MGYLKMSVWMAVAVCLTACSSSSDEEPETPGTKRIPINLSVGCGSYAADNADARIMDTYFEPYDAIGLYVASGSGLAASGNYVNNVRCVYTSSAAWKPDTELYWKDETTASDFYAYYPYTSGLDDALAFDFQVKSDQSVVEAYKQSDLVCGRTMGVKPTEAAVNIQTRHLMSNLVIKVLPGNGFTQEKLDAAEVKVKLDGLQTAARINLSDGSMTASGQVATHYPYFTDRQYKLLLVPQATAEPAVVTVTVDGREFKLKQQLTMKSGHRYTMPVTVDKTSNGINVGIDGWIDDGLDYGGVAE